MRRSRLAPRPQGHFWIVCRGRRPALQPSIIEFRGVRFSRPTSIEQCLAILAEDPEARLISGGTDLVVESNLRARRWSHLVSLEAIAELREFSENADAITIGAGLPLNEIATRWTSAPEAVGDWLRLFASPPLRNRATLGGNLATASPIGDGAPLLLALDASVHLVSRRGRRIIPLNTFFTGYRKTLLAADELIAAIEIPKPLPEFVRFYKVAKRRMDDISTVAAAMAMDWDGSGRIARATICVGRRRGCAYAHRGGRGSGHWASLERCGRGTRAGRTGADNSTDRRSSGIGRIPAGRGKKSDREIPVGAPGGGRVKIAGQAVPHESAREHVTGEALYTDDLLLRFPRLLHAWPVLSPHAHALVRSMDVSAALSEPGVATVLTEDDVPGEGDSGSQPAR